MNKYNDINNNKKIKNTDKNGNDDDDVNFILFLDLKSQVED